MPAETPVFTRPDDPNDVGKFATFNGTTVVWATAGSGTAETMSDHATPTGSTETIDLTTHRVHRVRWDANLALTVTGVPAGWAAFKFVLYHDSTTSPYSLTWFTGAKFDGGTAPFLLSSTADSVATFECWTWNGGTDWCVHHGGNFT